jgi:hypothetical protein
VIVCQALQETEISLNKVALGLKSLAVQGLRDTEALFEKLGKYLSRFRTLFLLTHLLERNNSI